jgi:hypothetical protein
MPEEKTVYCCAHPSCYDRNHNVYMTLEKCIKHEETCRCNPEKKSCNSCRWEDWHEEWHDGIWYGMMGHMCGHPDAHNSDYRCDAFGDDYVDGTDCPYWAPKTDKEKKMLYLRLKDPHGQLPYGYK